MTLFRQVITRWVDGEGKRVPKGTEGAKKVRSRSRKWYGHVGGKKVPLSASKAEALHRLAELRKDHEAGQSGLHARERVRPAAEHLDEFELELSQTRKGKRGGRATTKYVRERMATLRGAVAGCGWKVPADLDLGGARSYLARRLERGEVPAIPDQEWFTLGEMRAVLQTREDVCLKLIQRHKLEHEGSRSHRRYPRETLLFLLRNQRRRQGVSEGTAALQAGLLRRFGAWLTSRCGWKSNPLGSLEGGTSLDTDHRHDRRALTPDEIGRLIERTRTSTKTLRGLTGPDRSMLYLVALATGWRACELALLTPRLCLPFGHCRPLKVQCQESRFQFTQLVQSPQSSTVACFVNSPATLKRRLGPKLDLWIFGVDEMWGVGIYSHHTQRITTKPNETRQ